MERLTTWNGKKWILPQGKTSEGESYWRIIAERLAEYENTELTPDEIIKLKLFINMKLWKKMEKGD